MPKQARTPIRGIVVAGNSLEEAQELYRAVATGQDAQALHDEEETFIVLSSGSADLSMINPLTGENDLKVGDGLTEQMEFLSSDSQARNINYTICVAGCQAHVLADDKEMLHFCPACASTLEDLSEEQIAALNAEAAAAEQGEEEEATAGDEDGECDGCQESVVASGATVEEAIASYKGLISGEIAPVTMKCENVLVATAGVSNFDVYQGCAATVVDHEPELLESLSSNSDELAAHHFVCASASCESPHVISSDEMPVFCPSCSSGLIDPEEEATAGVEDDIEDEEEANAASDDEDYDDESDDEDEEDDEEDDDSDEDEDDSDEEFDDEEEIDEDDEGDSDDDEEEEDDIDEDEDDSDEDEDDEDDDDEALTMSVSSVQYKGEGRARNRREAATAAAAEDEPMVAVAASYVATAGALDLTKLDVAYAANIGGENIWVAFYQGVPVAKAVASKASDGHKQIFDTEVFGRAFKAQANNDGLDVAMQQMGFEEIKPEIKVAEYVQTEINDQVAAKTQEVQASAQRDRDELVERFGSAMALASTGINQGYFRGLSNPIKQSLIESLSAVGIDNAEALVTKVFLQHSDPYHKTLLAQASKIMGYDLEVQNQIAEAVAGHTAGEEATAATASAVKVGRPVTVKQPEQKQQIEATAAATVPADFQSRMRSAIGGLGKRN